MTKFKSLALTAGITLAAFSATSEALAESTSLSPISAALYPSVTSNLTVTGTRSFNVTVTHSDSGMFCSKIAEVELLDSSRKVVGSQKLSTPLCNIGPSDANVSVTPWSDSALLNACSGKTGTTVMLTATLDTCLNPTATSFNPGVLFTGQQNLCSKATFNATAYVTCPPAPTPPASNPPTTPASNPPTTPATTPSTPPTLRNPGPTTGAFVRGKQNMKVDASLLATLVALASPAQKKATLDADYAALNSAYNAYNAAFQAFQAKYTACMNQTYTPAQQIAACSDTDYAVQCEIKLVNACDAAEQQAVNTTRNALNAAAAKLTADAQALATATAN